MKKIFVKFISVIVMLTVLITVFTSNVFAIGFYQTYSYGWGGESTLVAIEELGTLALPSRNIMSGGASIVSASREYTTLRVSVYVTMEYFDSDGIVESSDEKSSENWAEFIIADEIGGEPEGVSIWLEDFDSGYYTWIAYMDITYSFDEGEEIFSSSHMVFSDGDHVKIE